VILFPFAILTIAGLANQVAIIVNFLSSRGQERQLAWQALYEERMEEEAAMNDDDVDSALRRTTDLEKEMRFLHQLAREQEILSMMYGLAWSLTGFIVFWIVGAAIFYALEGWSYGSSICMSPKTFLAFLETY
jgi:potassium channel subfamily K, other eukaryote